jgi:hypothetical protein
MLKLCDRRTNMTKLIGVLYGFWSPVHQKRSQWQRWIPKSALRSAWYNCSLDCSAQLCMLSRAPICASARISVTCSGVSWQKPDFFLGGGGKLMYPHYFEKDLRTCTTKLLSVMYSFVSVCLTTGPEPFPEQVIHRVRSSASSFIFQCLLFHLRSSSNCLHLITRLLVPSVFPYIFRSFFFK